MNSVAQALEPHAKRGASLVLDSRKLTAGDVFVAVQGKTCDGHSYIKDAVAANAGCIVHDASQDVDLPSIPSVAVEKLATRLGEIANDYYGAPSSKMKVVAVTGTKGKTTTSYWCAQLLGQAGYVGTLGAGSPEGELTPTGMTTPDVLALHTLLAGFAQNNYKTAVLETSSHGLSQHRLTGIDCDVAVFTNIGIDHLDYHGNERDYFATKLKLFARPEIDVAVINFDDAHATEVASSCAAEIFACGSARSNDLRWKLADDPSHGELSYANHTCGVTLPMPGAHNLANLGLAVAATLAAGHSWEQVTERFGSLHQLPGRLEKITGEGLTVYVDFAHTAEALKAALATLRAIHKDTKLSCVFGCGGDRDRSKRSAMGAIACELADKVIITNDNPRSEVPEKIADAIAAGAPKAKIELDRAAAIALAIKDAQPGEVILVAGKGDENHIEIAGRRLCHSDRESIRNSLQLV